MKYQYFIASRWRNRDQVLDLAKKLRGKGKSVYCFLVAPQVVHRIKNDPDEDMKSFEKRNWQNDSYVKEVFKNDIEAESLYLIFDEYYPSIGTFISSLK